MSQEVSRPPSSSRTGPPGGAAGWGLPLVLSGTMFVDALEVSLVLVALPEIQSSFGLSRAVAAWVLAGFPLGFAILLTAGRPVVRRFGLRRTYLGALLLFALAVIVGGAAPHPAVLVGAEAVKGACAALTAPAGLTILSAATADGRRGRAAALVYSVAGSAGAAAGMLASGALAGTSWRLTLALPLPVVLALAVGGHLVIPRDDPRGSGRHGLPEVAAVKLRLTAPLLRACAGAAALNGSALGFLMLVNFQMQGRLGWSSLHAALVCAPAYATLMLSVLIAKRLIGRWGTARPVFAGSLVSTLVYALYLWRPEPGGWGLGVLLASLGIGIAYLSSFAALNVAAARETEGGHPAAKSLLQTSVQASSVICPPLVAALPSGGAHPYGLLLVVGVSAAGLAVAGAATAGEARGGRAA
ncbi:MFS transporter [Streptomyces mirabilis]|uniref:MFS transporter n=1 Tax=Streptomyces mirabilis TaxID=68239 RepID=UPI0033E92AD4